MPTFRNVLFKLGCAMGLHEFTFVQLLTEMPKCLGIAGELWAYPG